MSWEARAASQRDREFFSSNTRVSFATLPPTPTFHKIPGQQNFLLRPSWESDINVRRPVQDGALMVLSTAGVTRGDVAVAVVAILCTGGTVGDTRQAEASAVKIKTKVRCTQLNSFRPFAQNFDWSDSSFRTTKCPNHPNRIESDDEKKGKKKTLKEERKRRLSCRECVCVRARVTR